ncbi:hypothetical protein A2U01_0013143 [Trifolium medium]|uniref:Uncharacterized protein n=1 Tax=Trifolium medium TaxID=97028 RepID=A0A392MXE8_9FABA|nr:hypothetical protein [Trifolium medium]
MRVSLCVGHGLGLGRDIYIPDESGDDTALAFRVAYGAAMECNCNDEKVCAYVESMLCSVVPEFKNSVEEALNRIGIGPCSVSLPSQAQAHKIEESDWPSILVIFGYCFLTLFKIIKIKEGESWLCSIESESSFHNKMTKWISEMREKVGCAPSNKLYIPFAYPSSKKNAIRTMLDSQGANRRKVLSY